MLSLHYSFQPLHQDMQLSLLTSDGFRLKMVMWLCSSALAFVDPSSLVAFFCDF